MDIRNLVLLFFVASLMAHSAQASNQLGRSDREQLANLMAWKDNPNIPKDTPLTRSLVKQIENTSTICAGIKNDSDLQKCSNLIAASSKMKDETTKSEQEIKAETQQATESLEAKREKIGPRVLKQQKEGLSPAERDMLQKNLQPSDVVNRDMKNRSAGAARDERAAINADKQWAQNVETESQLEDKQHFAKESASRTSEQLYPKKQGVKGTVTAAANKAKITLGKIRK